MVWDRRSMPAAAKGVLNYTTQVGTTNYVNLGTSASSVATFAWVTPAAAGTNYGIRIKQTATNCNDSTWNNGGAFIVSADTDHDGIPDAWETKYFGSLSSANATSDWDHDGSSDMSEYQAGTTPTNKSSTLRVTAVTNMPPNQWVIGWASVSNRFYRLNRATNLVAGFSTTASNIWATSPMNVYTDTPPTSAVFNAYRVQLQ